ncbi:MAG: shikimate kinase, partial [Clostridiales bacterium]|nr:shikimate kinase [Clostridiales bacterium]
ENIFLFKSIFESNGGKFYYVELDAPLDIRLNRNKTENRLFYKPEKQNIEFSEKQIFHAEKHHRNYSLPNELNCQNYIKIDNSELSAIDTAKIIKEKFNLN